MSEVLSYRITAYSKAFKKRVRIFTWSDEPIAGIHHALKEASDFGLADKFSDYRAELMVDTTRYFRTRSGTKATVHEVVTHNSDGDEVTFPIKCSIRADKPRARSRYAILTSAGRQNADNTPGPDDIVGYWEDQEVSA